MLIELHEARLVILDNLAMISGDADETSAEMELFPDVCKTPAAPSAVPIPYPNLIKASDSSTGEKEVKQSGKMVEPKRTFKQSEGDEPGTSDPMKREPRVVTEFVVTENQCVTIKACLKNGTNRTKWNMRVKLFVDNRLEDVTFISFIVPGETKEVKFSYLVPDTSSHTLEVMAVEAEGEGVLARTTGHLANKGR